MRTYLCLLGPFTIQPSNDAPEAPALNRKTRAILAYLAATAEPHSRRALWELFCQTANDPAGSLRWHLSRIRRNLDEEILQITPQDVVFNTAVAHTDLATFQETLSTPTDQSTEALAQAVDLYRGPFLDDLALRSAPEYDLWLLGERTRTLQLYEKGAVMLIGRYLQQRQYEAAISLAQALLQINPLLETAHKQLIWLYAQTGRRESALKQYERCRDLLQQELAVEPTAEVQALYTAVRDNQPLLPLIDVRPLALETLPVPDTRGDFVGREAEQDLLLQAWRKTQQMGGSAILIEAVAGGGKTRLVQHFFHTLPPRYTPLSGNCYESTRTIPYQPWLTILESRLQQLEAKEIERLAEPWRAQLSRLLPQVFPGTDGVPEQQEHLFRAVAELLLVTRDDPGVLLLEDLQWADEASLQLFLFMAQFIQHSQSPALLLGTFRSEEAAENSALQTLLHDALRDGLAQRLALPPLGVEEIGALIGSLWPDLPGETHLDELRDSLLAAAGGNPLFVTEILRELAQTAVLPSPLPIPPSLQELTDRRLRRLPASSRQVLETLAVLDQPSPFELAQQISGRTEDETINAMEIGLRWHFLAPHQSDQYGFSHDLIGGAVRRQLSQIRRQRLHHRVATALTRRGADAAILAHHWGVAGNQEQRANFALQAGEQALHRAAFNDAVHHFQTAVDALPSDENQRRFQATLGLVRALEATSNVTALPEKLAMLANLAEKEGEPVYLAKTAQYQAHFAHVQGELDGVEEIARQGLKWAVAAQAVSVQAKLLETLGKTYRDQGDYATAYTYAEQALELFRTDNNRSGQVAVLNLLGNLNVHQGQHRQAVKAHRQALALCRQFADPFSESRVLAWLADALWYLGDYDEARTVIEEGLAVSREIGDKRGEAVQLNNLAGLAIVKNDPRMAIDYYQQALAIAKLIHDPRGIAIYHSNIAGAYIGIGDASTAMPYLDEAIAIAQEAGLPRQEAYAYHTKGHVYQEMNDPVAARAAFEQALSLREELGEQFRIFLTLTQLVEACVDLGDLKAAESYLQLAQDLYDSLYDEIPQYAHQSFHYIAFLFHKAQANTPAAVKHLEQAHRALQSRLSELDSDARDQLIQALQSQAILAAIADLDQ